jgi:magnesium chelatase family protein
MQIVMETPMENTSHAHIMKLSEDKLVTVTRVSGTLTFPANFMLVGALNPCPCGYANDPVKECTCTPSQIIRYQKQISGPLLDRIDIHMSVPRVEYEKLSGERLRESSAVIRSRVQKARAIQTKRFEGTVLLANADMGPAEVRQFCRLDENGSQLMRAAMNQMNLSARAYHRILKMARTIADLADCAQIQSQHLAEALQYRPRLDQT